MRDVKRLIEAVQQTEYARVDAMLDAGCDVAKTDEDGMTPLHHAAIVSSPELFERLLECGAPLEARDRWGRTPLMALCASARPVRQQEVFDPPVRGRGWPTYPRHLQTLGLAILWGAQVDTLADNGFSAVHVAASNGAADVLRMLLDGNASPDQATPHGYRPLHAAADKGETHCAEALLAAGATVDASDQYGFTPLHGACLNGHAEVARLLVDAGADPSRRIVTGYGRARAGMNAADLAQIAGLDPRWAPQVHGPQVSMRCG